MNSKLLILDDELKHLNSFYSVYRKNFDISITHTALEAVEIIKKCNYSIIVSDYKMNDINGLEFLEYARNISPNSVRILLTGYTNEKLELDAFNNEIAYKVVRKPCSKLEFLDILLNASELYNKNLNFYYLNNLIAEIESEKFVKKKDRVDLLNLFEGIKSDFKTKFSVKSAHININHINDSYISFDGYILTDKVLFKTLIYNIINLSLDFLSNKERLNIFFDVDDYANFKFEYRIKKRDYDIIRKDRFCLYNSNIWLMTYSIRLILEKLCAEIFEEKLSFFKDNIEYKFITVLVKIPLRKDACEKVAKLSESPFFLLA